MALNDVYKFAIAHNFNGLSRMVTTHHYEVTGGPGNGSAQDIVATWQALVMPEWRGTFTSRMDLAELECKAVRPIGQELEIVSIALGGLLPDSAGDIASFILAPVVSLRTGLSGKSRRGRNYLMPPTENYMSDGKINGTLIAAINLYYNAARTLVGAADGTEYTMTIFSRLPSALSTIVTNHITRDVMGKQSRRQLGVGQ